MSDDLETIKRAVAAQERRLAEAVETLQRAAGKAGAPSITRAGAKQRLAAGYAKAGDPAKVRAARRGNAPTARKGKGGGGRGGS